MKRPVDKELQRLRRRENKRPMAERIAEAKQELTPEERAILEADRVRWQEIGHRLGPQRSKP